MNKPNFKSALMAVIFGLTISTSSLAADVVFDPANFVKNTITAMQEVMQTAKQASILSQEIKQYQMMVRDLNQLNPSVINQGINRGYIPAGDYETTDQVIDASSGVYSTYKNVATTMQNMNTTYKGMDTLMSEIDRTSIKSKVAPERIIQYDFQRAQSGITQDKNYYTDLQVLNSQLAQHKKRSDYLATQLPQQSGTVGMLQIVGSQNSLMQDQLSHLIQISSISAEKSLQQSLQKNEQDERDARSREEAIDTEKNAAKYFTNKK